MYFFARGAICCSWVCSLAVLVLGVCVMEELRGASNSGAGGSIFSDPLLSFASPCSLDSSVGRFPCLCLGLQQLLIGDSLHYREPRASVIWLPQLWPSFTSLPSLDLSCHPAEEPCPDKLALKQSLCTILTPSSLWDFSACDLCMYSESSVEDRVTSQFC